MNEAPNQVTWRFPFGEPVKIIKQTDCTPKQVFVLGVYASAVHAKWLDPQGKTVVQALAVASEPYIFWKGENAEQYIPKIPAEIGRLIPADKQLNGPSGIALDEEIVAPLGYTREHCWLCDLVPYSCANNAQRKANTRAYTFNPLVKKHRYPTPSVPAVPKVLANETRRAEILDELIQSKAQKLVLLGDMPIKWFLSAFEKKWQHLSDFVSQGRGYGMPVEAKICDISVEVIPLAHPRQVARLGAHSVEWFEAHKAWKENRKAVA